MPRTLIELLQANYRELKDEECRDRVIQFIRDSDTILGNSLDFIKSLTKVASHILKTSPELLEGLLEKLYQFHIEGVGKAGRERTIPGLHNEVHFLNLEAHLFSHAGEVAKILFDKTRNLEWGVRWYEGERNSANIAVKFDPKYAGHAYSFAGSAAKALFEFTKDPNWAEMWYNNLKKVADLSVTINTHHAVYCYALAGDAAKSIFQITQDNQDIEWAKKWFEAYRNSAQLSEKIDQKHSYNAYKIAGEAAKLIFEKQTSVEVAENCYNCYRKSAEIASSLDPRFTAKAYSFAGHAAKSLYVLTGKESWAEKAVECYEYFLRYFIKNPDDKMKNTIKLVKSEWLNVRARAGI